MASSSLVPVPGASSELQSKITNAPFDMSCELDFEGGASSLQTQCKKIKIYPDNDKSWEILRKNESSLPTLLSTDYYMEPSLINLAARELMDPGYCSRVPNFTVGRLGYGCVKFLGMTDVRWLDLGQIVKFRRHEIIVYPDESTKPAVGRGLNKDAEVSLNLQIGSSHFNERLLKNVVEKLRESTEKQGAHFVSFDPANGEWKFSVCHFSRFGLSEDEEEDIVMDDVVAVEEPVEMNGVETLEKNEDFQIELETTAPMPYHSLPAHLGLDPVKMKDMRMLMFPVEEENEVENFNYTLHQKLSSSKEHARHPLQNSIQ